MLSGKNVQSIGSSQVDVQQVIADLLHGNQPVQGGGQLRNLVAPSHNKPLESKMAGLQEIYRVLVEDKNSASAVFTGSFEELFAGMTTCLQTTNLQQLQDTQEEINNNSMSDFIIEIILKANQILFEMMPDIQNSEELEKQIAQLIPIFIENLGSPKATVRKSTHKCIGTYVKLTRKLEVVLLHILNTGLENPNSRTRQHSMLVIPALLSLKSSIMDQEYKQMKDLLQGVIKRIRSDQSEIVSKTGKKLILELLKCYPEAFKTHYIDNIRNQDDLLICKAVLANDEQQVKQLIQEQSAKAAPQPQQQQYFSQPSQSMPAQSQQVNLVKQTNSAIPGGADKSLSSIGQEIFANRTPSTQTQGHAKNELHPRALNGLLYGFINDNILDQMNEKNQWKDRCNAIEIVESELNKILQSSSTNSRVSKAEFMPYATPFFGFIIQYIKDINFKTCLTAIQMTDKLMLLNLVNVQKYYDQVVTNLIEKLSDSKVIIRQAVLKCCGHIIQNQRPTPFAHQAIKYLQHTNWHVREGILHLVANCLIVQGHEDELGSQSTQQNQQDSILDTQSLSLSPSLISELYKAFKIEAKVKIQQMIVDCLALCIEISQNKQKSEHLILREMGIAKSQQVSTSSLTSKEYTAGMNSKESQTFQEIKERQTADCLPAMQIDGSIEFKPQGISSSNVLQQQPDHLSGHIGNTKHYNGKGGEPAHLEDESPYKVGEKQPSVSSQANQNDSSRNDSLQMRYQQERIQAAQQRQGNDLDAVNKNRQQYSLSTINNSNTIEPKLVDKSINQSYMSGAPTQKKLEISQNTAPNTNDAQNKNSNSSQAGPNALNLRRRQDTNGSGLVYQDTSDINKNGGLRESRPKVNANKVERKSGLGSEPHTALAEVNTLNKEKVQMWLPTYNEEGQSNQSPLLRKVESGGQASQQDQTPFKSSIQTNQETPHINSQLKGIQNTLRADRLNATASSQATFVNEDTRNLTDVNKNRKLNIQDQSNFSEQDFNRSQINSTIGDRKSDGPSIQKPISLARPMPQSQGTVGITPASGVGFTPERVNGKQMAAFNQRQRTLDENTLSQKSPSPKNGRLRIMAGSSISGQGQANTGFISMQQSPQVPDNKSTNLGITSTSEINNNQMITHNDIRIQQQRNMSQSSGAPGGFGGNKNQINERLQLLKSTFKYKNQSEQESNIGGGTKSFEQQSSDPATYKYNVGSGLSGSQPTKATSEYNARGINNKTENKLNALNSNNFMMQTGGAGGLSGPGGGGLGNIPQQTHNSFGLSNVSTNINNINSNNNAFNSKSFSANKQLQSTNTTGYNLTGSGSGRGTKIDYNQQPNSLYNNVNMRAANQSNDNSQSASKVNMQQNHPSVINTLMSGSQAGPVKATALPDVNMQTIQVGKKEDDQNHQLQSRMTRKPPIKSNSTPVNYIQNQKEMQRASSVNNNPSVVGSLKEVPEVRRISPGVDSKINTEKQKQQKLIEQGAYPAAGIDSNTTHYNAPEEPLRNPEVMFKQAVDQVKSDDWSKAFDGLNVIKRVAMFHKELLSISNGLAGKDCIKAVVKQTDNLRSQVSKNACMTLKIIFTELPTRDLDSNVDLVIGALIKKATDTNQFVSEQAEQALMVACYACNEQKVFNILQQTTGKSNILKEKICMSYTCLITKLGQKIKSFKDSDRLVKTVVQMLSESAVEVRNQAKLAILSIKNTLQNGREFDGLLLRCGLSDKQLEQVRKVVEQGDQEHMSSAAYTKYGGSMRGSSLDQRNALGSDGFNGSNYIDSKMQSTFLSGGIQQQTSNGFGITGSTNNQSFKKRQPSVSKPVNPQLLEDFKNLINSCNSNDWSKRLQAIDNLDNWVTSFSISVKQTQPSKFIQLIDTYCNFLQDNNAKVQTKAIQSFRTIIQNDNLRQLIDQNLSMIVQAISQNLSSSSPAVRTQNEQLLNILEETTENRAQLIQPIVAQLNLQNNRAKPQLIYQLTNLILKLDKSNIVERYVTPLFKPGHKIQIEAKVNKKLSDALTNLEYAVKKS